MLASYAAFSGSTQTNIQALTSFSIRENAGSPGAATVLLRDGGPSGEVGLVLEMAADESIQVTFVHPIFSHDGWYVEVVAGTVEGALHGGT